MRNDRGSSVAQWLAACGLAFMLGADVVSVAHAQTAGPPLSDGVLKGLAELPTLTPQDVEPPQADWLVVPCQRRTAVLRVIDARDTLMSAVLADRLVLRGATRDVLAFHDGLIAYVHGAVRARSFPELLRQFRQRRRRTSMPCAGVGEDT